MANVIHRQSFDQGVLDAEALLLMRVNFRKLPETTVEKVANTIIGPNKIKEQDMVWFADGYVTMDTPRDYMITEALRQFSTGFALALANGKILKTYGKDEFAQAATDIGRVSMSVEARVLIEDSDPTDEDDE